MNSERTSIVHFDVYENGYVKVLKYIVIEAHVEFVVYLFESLHDRH